MNAAANPVQAAIYALLTGDATLMALVTGVFDAGGIPENTAPPYVTIGSVLSEPFVTFSRSGERLTAIVNVWTQSGGFKGGNTILARLNQLLGDTHLTVAGYDLARSTFARYNNAQDPERNLEQTIASYRILLQETP